MANGHVVVCSDLLKDPLLVLLPLLLRLLPGPLHRHGLAGEPAVEEAVLGNAEEAFLCRFAVGILHIAKGSEVELREALLERGGKVVLENGTVVVPVAVHQCEQLPLEIALPTAPIRETTRQLPKCFLAKARS